ncbi:MAG: hypothetical protein ABT00_21735 [Bordetella sp. SCN 68-11]|nr:MAG: hypothetical protein ABT00_21735 [Bordetella sp. SCN 68-11]
MGHVQLGFVAVAARDAVAQAADEACQRLRPAEAAQDEIGGGVVAGGHGGMAKLGQGHAAIADVFPGHGRPIDEVLPGVADPPVQRVFAPVMPGQHESGGEQLEGTEHLEAFVGAAAEFLAGGGVDDAHAQPSVGQPFQACQLVQGGVARRDRQGARRLAGPGAAGAAGEAGKDEGVERAACGQGRFLQGRD